MVLSFTEDGALFRLGRVISNMPLALDKSIDVGISKFWRAEFIVLSKKYRMNVFKKPLKIIWATTIIKWIQEMFPIFYEHNHCSAPAYRLAFIIIRNGQKFLKDLKQNYFVL